MKVAFITQGKNVSSARFRTQQYFPLLTARGIRCAHFPRIPKARSSKKTGAIGRALGTAVAIPTRTAAIVQAPMFDVVVLQRELLRFLSPWPEQLLAKVSAKLIFDFDDAIWLRYRGADRQNPIAHIISSSDSVCAGNKYLAEYAEQYNPNVFIVPTPIDTQHITPRTADTVDDKFRIGWTGASSTLKYLSELKPVFRKLRRLGDNIILSIICDQKPTEDLGLPIEYVPWNPTNEVDALRRFDVGVMPIPNDEWSRGKCSFKLLQYMAAAVPSICSPVGMNIDVIGTKGSRGILAESPADWETGLAEYYGNVHFRRRVGDNGRAHVDKFYSINVQAESLENILTQTVHERSL
ncbi:MAG: glycosyltransferase family 4 protein [Caldilineaceae bacterium]|nr:glycosyltransferase family 4 protein [Caldilineaceae bacterium]